MKNDDDAGALHCLPGQSSRQDQERSQSVTSGDTDETSGDAGDALAVERPMRVAGLHYGVAWPSERLQWAPGAFPTTIALGGWTLELTEHHLAGRPGSKFLDEGSARAALEPHLEAWQAELAVVHDILLAYWFQNAEMVPDVTIAMSGWSSLMIDARIDVSGELTVVRTLSELPAPTWLKPPSQLAHDAREYCLLPMRSGRRPEADAAYWLFTQLKAWTGNNIPEAATRLNISNHALDEMRKLSADAYDRKVASRSQPLTSDERARLHSMVELIVHRLHQWEVGESIGEYKTRGTI
jgi:hypothetical protein